MPKPDMEMILGLGKKPGREMAPPPFGGPKAAEPEVAEEMPMEGSCPITCPKCGEGFTVQVVPAAAPEEEIPAGEEMEQTA